MTISLPYRFTPRDYQIPALRALDSGKKRVVLVWARRHGKDKTVFNWCIKELVREPKTCFYCLPEFTHGRRVIWDNIDNSGFPLLGHIPKSLVKSFDKQSMKISFFNGSIFQIVGADNYDSLVGANPKIVVFSEYAVTNPKAWDYLRPILDSPENNGTAVFISTPRGKNHLYDLYKIALSNPDRWYCEIITNNDTGLLSSEDVDRLRKEGMSEDMIQQELYCFPPNALVLCGDTVKPISEVVVGDAVYTHSARIRRVDRVMSREYHGDMIGIESFGSHRIECTPNHPVRVYNVLNQSYSWKRADEITIDDWLTTPKISKTKPIISESLAKLVAWHVCEGSTAKTVVQFSLGLHEREYIDEIVSLLTEEGYKSSVVESGTAANIVVCSASLADFMVSQTGSLSHFRRLPLVLIRGHEKAVWETMLKADGHVSYPKGKRCQKRYSFTTASLILVNQMHLLSASQGMAGKYTERKGYEYHIEGRVGQARKSYCLQVQKCTSHNKRSQTTRKTKHSIIGKVKKVSKTNYKCLVYNLSVSTDESYLVNGRAVHNCSFSGTMEGSYYARYIEDAETQGRIGTVPYDKNLLVYTAWDIGIGDAMAIAFFQQKPDGTIAIIDHYENRGYPISHYIQELKAKAYMYGKHYLPHDGRSRSVITGGTFQQAAEELGLTTEVIPNTHSIEEGIEIVRGLFPRMIFDKTKCEYLLKCLQNYRSEYDEKNRILKPRPCHDWTSHSSDSFRYLCLAIKNGLSSGAHTQEWASLKQKKNYYSDNLNQGFHDGINRSF